MGRRLDDLPYDVEILIVGAVAGLVVGVIDPSRHTLDCDMMEYKPEDALGAVERAAELVGMELGLPDNWLNSEVHIRRDVLPDGWEGRKHVWVNTATSRPTPPAGRT